MKSLRILFTFLSVTLATSLFGQEFFSKAPAQQLFNIGVRLGVNSSNRTFPGKAFQDWNVNSWGTGFEAGCVVDLNMREYFSIQPGIFFETRSGNYAYAHTYYKNGESKDFTQLGHDRSVSITIPVLYSQKFNLTDNLRWIAELGPYFQLFLHDTSKEKIQIIEPQPTPTTPIEVSYAKPSSFDFGFKIGTGFSLKQRYSVYVHYMAGLTKAWKEPLSGGRNKAWVFTVGYDL